MPGATQSPEEQILTGIAASPGVAVGQGFVYLQREMEVPQYAVIPAQVEGEVKRLEAALLRSRQQLAGVRDEVCRRLGENEAMIFDAQMLVLEDNALIDEIIKEVHATQQNIDFCLKQVADRYIAVFANINDAYFKERAADIRDVAKRLLRNLLGRAEETLGKLIGERVLVTDELSPSEVAALEKGSVLGLATDVGGRTSHAVIMARAFEIPAVVGLEDFTRRVQAGDEVLVDGYDGLVILHPSESTLFRYGKLRREKATIQRVFNTAAMLPAQTRDGRVLTLRVNVDGSEDLGKLKASGADGVGLFRTEGLFLRGDRFPNEEQQYQVYRQYVEAFAPSTVTIRTLDLGGDKAPPGDYFSEKELNPFLGYRGIRFCLDVPAVFKEQLRAILRASAHGKVKVMFPMISGLGELLAARRLLAECQEELRARGQAFDAAMPVGSMIEVPGAALVADLLAPFCDFFSIGTNDLIQYLLAVDRVNQRVANLYDPNHPAVMRTLARIIEAGRDAGIPVSVCGEMGGDPIYAALLFGMGVHELSVSAHVIPEIKFVVRSMNFIDARALADNVLHCGDAKSIATALRQFYNDCIPQV